MILSHTHKKPTKTYRPSSIMPPAVTQSYLFHTMLLCKLHNQKDSSSHSFKMPLCVSQEVLCVKETLRRLMESCRSFAPGMTTTLTWEPESQGPHYRSVIKLYPFCFIRLSFFPSKYQTVFWIEFIVVNDSSKDAQYIFFLQPFGVGVPVIWFWYRSVY